MDSARTRRRGRVKAGWRRDDWNRDGPSHSVKEGLTTETAVWRVSWPRRRCTSSCAPRQASWAIRCLLKRIAPNKSLVCQSAVMVTCTQVSLHAAPFPSATHSHKIRARATNESIQGVVARAISLEAQDLSHVVTEEEKLAHAASFEVPERAARASWICMVLDDAHAPARTVFQRCA